MAVLPLLPDMREPLGDDLPLDEIELLGDDRVPVLRVPDLVLVRRVPVRLVPVRFRDLRPRRRKRTSGSVSTCISGKPGLMPAYAISALLVRLDPV